MSKHTLMTRGHVFEWNDDDPSTKELELLKLHSLVGDMHSCSTYTDKDPEEQWNTIIANIQNSIIDGVIEFTTPVKSPHKEG